MIPAPSQILRYPKIWPAPDHCRQSGDRRYHAGSSDYSGAGKLCQGYGRGMPGRLVPELYQPYGDPFRLYGAVYGSKDCGPVPQRPGLLQNPSGRAGNGGIGAGGTYRNDRRDQPYGMAAENTG